jgi:hypothetical protein
MPVWIARDELVESPWRPISGNDGETSDMAQQRHGPPVPELECDTRHPDPIDIALEDRRHAEPPGWKNENDTFSTPQPLDLQDD